MGYHPDATQTWACSCWTPPDSMVLNPTLAQLRGPQPHATITVGRSLMDRMSNGTNLA